MKPICINVNDEYKIKIETAKEFKGSIFEEVYHAASKNLSEIIYQSNNGKDYDTYNNIIAFTGERGKGKSSSMISFRNALPQSFDNKNSIEFFNTNGYHLIHNHNFLQIDVIDPSLFRGNESLFEIVVAKMFAKFQNEIKQNKISDDDKREIIKLFQKVFDNMKIINSDKSYLYNQDSIEALSNLAYSSNLKEVFFSLVDKYLNVFEDKKSFLLIAIDDFDLNISKAYEMLEDIRHFLIQKRIILLVACKIEQLKDSVVNEIVKDYRHKLNLEQKNKIYNLTTIDERKSSRFDDRKISNSFEISNEYILIEQSNKAEKYIEKLIPFNHQIFIPSLTDFCEISFLSQQDFDQFEFSFFESKNSLNDDFQNKPSLIYIGDTKSLNNVNLEDILELKNTNLKENLIIDEKLFVEKNIYDCLLKLIYKKSKIFINKTDYRYHSIFPSTLRELNELIKVFNNDNVLINFRKYILNKKINELPINLKNIFLEIDDQDFSFLNSHIINQLGNIKKLFEDTNDVKIDLRLSNYNPSLTSIGEVFSKLKIFYLNVKSTNIYWYKFLDFLSIYYAIRINQTLVDQPKLLLEYCKGGLYDGDYQIFPEIRIVTDLNTIKDSRDWVEYKMNKKLGQTINSIFKSLSEDNAFWLAFFIQYFGASDSMTDYNYPYFRKINQGGGPIYNLIFSPFAIFTNILFPVEVWYSVFNKAFDEENIIMKDILNWKKENFNFQFLITNPMFFSELIENVSRFSTDAFKSSTIPNYFETLYVYFNDSLKKSLKSIKEKYNYLEINENCFDFHPIIMHWNRIIDNDEYSKQIADIFEVFVKKHHIEKYKFVDEKYENYLSLIKKKFNQYKSYLLDETNTNSKSLTYLMNSFDKNSNIYKDLHKIRYNDNKTILEKKFEAYTILNNLTNGQSS